MNRLLMLTGLLLPAGACFAQGWLDYELDIGDGYRIIRANSETVGLCNSGGSVLVPANCPSVGPVISYITTPKYIFTKNLARKPRNLFAGDTPGETDPTRTYFFIVVKGTKAVMGPLSEKDFATRSEVADAGTLEWRTPRDPSVLHLLAGYCVCLAFIIPLLAIKFYWITAPVLMAMILATVLLVRRRRRMKLARGT